jgi:hypothetical protein
MVALTFWVIVGVRILLLLLDRGLGQVGTAALFGIGLVVILVRD